MSNVLEEIQKRLSNIKGQKVKIKVNHHDWNSLRKDHFHFLDIEHSYPTITEDGIYGYIFGHPIVIEDRIGIAVDFI